MTIFRELSPGVQVWTARSTEDPDIVYLDFVHVGVSPSIHVSAVLTVAQTRQLIEDLSITIAPKGQKVST